jgi:hypothetical protein
MRQNTQVQSSSCLDLFLSLAFAQLSCREELARHRISLRAMEPRLYPMLLWQLGKRSSKDANLDGRVGLPPGRHSQKTSLHRPQPLQTPIDSQCHPLRKKRTFYRSFPTRELNCLNEDPQQPTDSIHLMMRRPWGIIKFPP